MADNPNIKDSVLSLLDSLANEIDYTKISADSLVKAGELCFELGSYKNAERYFNKAISSDPEHSDALNNLGAMNIHYGNYEIAADLFTKALSFNPNNKEAKQNLVAVATITSTEKAELEFDAHFPVINTVRINSFHEYANYASQTHLEHSKREQIEKSLINGAQVFMAEGYCYVCKKNVNFLVDYLASRGVDEIITPNWRERVVCPCCWLANRMRASIHLFEQLLKPTGESSIFITEQLSPVYRWLASNYSNVQGSEFLGEPIPFGETDSRGIRNESLTELTFPDEQFDFILSFDVFEHIPELLKAFGECFRVLKPGGSLLFSVPFSCKSESNVVLAVVNDNDEVEHLLPPEYHANPVHDEGCLCYYVFGWEMVQQLREVGFDDVSAQFYWSRELGYLGEDQIMFIARKG